LHAACVRRRDTDAGPVTFVSCDNLPGNGDRLQAALLEFAGLGDADIADWIGANVHFPSTMVDRIVPATTTEDIDAAAAATGVYDAGLVCTEPFTQWVIEDRFANGRPAWETAGALLVDDVTPYETAKLRLLNGAHSTLAYLGYLAGFEYVHEVMAEPAMAGFLATLMRREISPVTPAPAGMAHDTYIAALLERFGNPALRHRTSQIAMDGSQKLPQRLLGTVREQLSRDGPIAGLALATAAWMRYVLGRDEQGGAIDVQDPLAGRFAAVARDTGARSPAAVESLLAIDAIFGDDLRANRRFRQALIAAFDDLVAIGALATVRRFAAAEPGP
jgi:fructuronate reductase